MSETLWRRAWAAALVTVVICVKAAAGLPFEGEPTTWHEGYARYDFVMDDPSGAIQPFRRPEKEGFGIGNPKPGEHRCVVVAPKAAAAGNPWSWRGCYWDHQPQTEIELLRRGFHIAYISASATLRPGPEWDVWYRYLTEKHDLSKKPAFIGMSRGGEFAYTWSVAHPGNVACIYADNPGGNDDVLVKVGLLAQHDVPLFHVCGSIDPLLARFSTPIENIYYQFGGRISVMIKEGRGHHPHSLQDPKPMADFIQRSVQESSNAPPAFVGAKFVKTSFYSIEDQYRNFSQEGTYITCRGPQFTNSYSRYVFQLDGVEGPVTVVAPVSAAPGKPWIFRADYLRRDARVDLALLAQGFHCVTVAVPYNADGPSMASWSAVYQHLFKYGFSPRPVMAGAGGAAGEAYAWAIANPDKVSCIYAENPRLRSNVTSGQPLDNLAPLAGAHIPIMHVCGSRDPWLEDNSRVLEKRYSELGGKLTLILAPGREHYPLGPDDPAPVVKFITESVNAP